MTDPRTLELIDASLDGELPPAEREELARRLAADPEAQAHAAQLARMVGSLGRLPPVAPPGDLRQRIVRAAPTRLPTPAARVRPGYAKPALALAAGLLAVAFGLQWMGGSGGLAPGALVATMGAAPPAPPPVPVSGPGLSGDVGLRPDRAGWILAIDLAADAPVEVSASWPAAALRLDGEDHPGRLAFTHPGRGERLFHLQAARGGEIHLTLRANGALVDEAVVPVPPAP